MKLYLPVLSNIGLRGVGGKCSTAGQQVELHIKYWGLSMRRGHYWEGGLYCRWCVVWRVGSIKNPQFQVKKILLPDKYVMDAGSLNRKWLNSRSSNPHQTLKNLKNTKTCIYFWMSLWWDLLSHLRVAFMSKINIIPAFLRYFVVCHQHH